MDLETIKLNEISQTQKDKFGVFSVICNSSKHSLLVLRVVAGRGSKVGAGKRREREAESGIQSTD